MAAAERNTCFVTVVSWNTLLLLPLLANENVGDCSRRAREMAQVLIDTGADVVGLQECWGAGAAEMEGVLSEQFFVPSPFRAWKKLGFAGDIVNSLYFWGRGTGGLLIASRYQTAYTLNVWQQQWRESKTTSRKGIAASLIQMGSFGPDDKPPSRCDHTVFLFATLHLDPVANVFKECKEQRSQLEQALEFLHHIVGSEPRIQAVVLCGDFNLASTMDGMHDLFHSVFSACNPQDLHLNYLRKIGAKTREPTYDKKQNKLVKWNQSVCLDHMFSFGKLGGLALRHVEVEEFQLIRQAHDDALSDHWGIKARIRF